MSRTHRQTVTAKPTQSTRCLQCGSTHCECQYQLVVPCSQCGSANDLYCECNTKPDFSSWYREENYYSFLCRQTLTYTHDIAFVLAYATYNYLDLPFYTKYGKQILEDHTVQLDIKWWALASQVGPMDLTILHWLQDNYQYLQESTKDEASILLDTLSDIVE